jgi:CDP-diacylglycerol--serine O-phosphatidyltransferase
VFGADRDPLRLAGNISVRGAPDRAGGGAGRAGRPAGPDAEIRKRDRRRTGQLCDFVNFGVVPALVLYLWGLRSEMAIGWIAVLVYAVCCMLRLARFNVGSRKADPAEKTTFIGVPSPAGAMLALFPIYVGNVTDLRLPALVVAVWMVAVGALMISRVRTPSLKRATVAASYASYVLVAAVAVVASLITYPWATMLILSLAYLGAVLFLAVSGLRKPG